MVRLWGLAFLMLVVAAVCTGPLLGQNRPKRKAKAGREGEVVAKAAREERHPDKLKIGEEAPDFALTDPAGENTFKLSDFRGKRPVVLTFGSLTCPPFRRRVLDVDKLYEEYKDRIEFRFVYIREAHPDSMLFVIDEGKEALQKVEQTDTLEKRGRNANLCTATLKLKMPVVVDTEDNAVNKTYAGWPIRLVIVDKTGKLAHISGPGPSGFDPSEVAVWLKENCP
jgi:thiol-disulfide isomerase/thioredoxin